MDTQDTSDLGSNDNQTTENIALDIKYRVYYNTDENAEPFKLSAQKLGSAWNPEPDSCDNCNKQILYGAFVSPNIVNPKIALNEAYICKECYDSLGDHVSLPFEDKSHVRISEIELSINDTKAIRITKMFLPYDNFIHLLTNIFGVDFTKDIIE